MPRRALYLRGSASRGSSFWQGVQAALFTFEPYIETEDGVPLQTEANIYLEKEI